MTRKQTWVLPLLLLLLAAFAAGCGDKEYKPVAIQEGVDKCEVCQMLIKDDHNATEIILKDGKPLKFDDIGDMFVWLKEHGREQVGAIFVRDYKTKEWIGLDKATYVYDAANKTPMAFGVFSFKSEAEADSFIKEKGAGTKMTAKDLDNHHWKNTRMGGGHNSGHGAAGGSK